MNVVEFSDIVGVIGAFIFAVLVALLAVPLVKLGRVLDATTSAIKILSDNVTPILEESAQSVAEANKQLARVDTITSNIAEVTGNVSALVALVGATVGGPLIKLAGFTAGVKAALGAGKPRAKAPGKQSRKRRAKRTG